MAARCQLCRRVILPTWALCTWWALPSGTWRTLRCGRRGCWRPQSLVAAEDTRVTRRLLTHLEANPRLVSCNEHNWSRRLPMLLEALEGSDVALVTDAGSPGISDPGAGLVAAVAEAGYEVVGVPGVSAVAAALSVAGFAADRFVFLGFLPPAAGRAQGGVGRRGEPGADAGVVRSAPSPEGHAG